MHKTASHQHTRRDRSSERDRSLRSLLASWLWRSRPPNGNSGEPSTQRSGKQAGAGTPLAPPTSPRPRPAEETRIQTERVIQGSAARTYWVISTLWAVLNIGFWSWWLWPGHVEAGWLFLAFSAAFFYQFSFLPSVYLYFVGRMERPKPILASPGLRVAMISLCVPGAESFEVIAKQMAAMKAVRYPHDTWVLDEGNDPAVRAEAERLGVRYFTRAGVARYNQPGPPFKAKTKAGNVNAWLDAYGKEYELFVQLDIDHIPIPEYLDRVLGFFADHRVAWVQAPSVYGNLENWVARGAAEQELVLQGPLQMGYFGATRTPFIIGSHSTYRTSAVLEIGGFQPTRAEDHLDTVVLASRGYYGCYLPEQIATGRGPDTFETYLRQQFAWAYSMMQVRLSYTPRLIRHFRPGQLFQFLYTQSWYPQWSLTMALLFLLPAISLLTGQRQTNVPILVFAFAWLPLDVMSFITWIWTRRWHHPRGLRLSWRGILLNVARWPIVLWAYVNVLLRVEHPYMITPKGTETIARRASVRSQLIYLVLIWVTLGASLYYIAQQYGIAGLEPRTQTNLWGYVLLGLWGSTFPLAVVVVTFASDFIDRLRLVRDAAIALRAHALAVLLLAVTLSMYSVILYTAGPQLTQPALWINPGDSTEIAQTDTDGERPASPATPTWRAAPAVTEIGGVPAPPSTEVSTPPQALALPSEGIAIGAYDPDGLLANVDYAIERWYVRQDHPEDLQAAMDRARNERTVLVTIEPLAPDDATENVLDLIVAGALDDDLRALASVTKAREPQAVYAIWGHEMEIVDLYPWSVEDPERYRAAFRHVVEVFREEGVSNVWWVWQPAGNPGAEQYYPGDDVVDYVGVTVLEDERWDRLFGQEPQSFDELFGPRYKLLGRFDKPVIIAELGVSGDEARQTEWLVDAGEAMQQYPRLRAAAYFNAVNVPNSHMSFLPDWRISEGTFQSFLTAAQP